MRRLAFMIVGPVSYTMGYIVGRAAWKLSMRKRVGAVEVWDVDRWIPLEEQ